MTTDPARCISAARRVLALIRDLRRRNEAWADDDPELIEAGNAIVRGNVDVSTYDEHRASFAPMVRSEDVLTDVVAAIISEEVNRR